MISQNTPFPESSAEYGSFCLHISQDRPKYTETVRNAAFSHIEGKSPAARVKATGILPGAVFRKPADVTRNRIHGRWHCDGRISNNCVSRGFLESENIDFVRCENRNRPYLVATNEPYQAIGSVKLQVTFPGVQGLWELEAMIMDYARLCRYDDPRQNDMIPTGDLEVPNDRPLWFDLLLGKEFVDEYQRQLDGAGTLRIVKSPVLQ